MLTMTDVLALVKRIYEDNFQQFLINPNPELIAEFIKGMHKFKYGIRWYSVEHDELIAMWDTVRDNTPILDFVMTCASDLYAHMRGARIENVEVTYYNYHCPSMGWNELCCVLGEAVAAAREPMMLPNGVAKKGVTDTPFTYMDSDFIQRGMSRETWQQVFGANAWLVFAYLYRMSDVEITAIEKKNPR